MVCALMDNKHKNQHLEVCSKNKYFKHFLSEMFCFVCSVQILYSLATYLQTWLKLFYQIIPKIIAPRQTDHLQMANKDSLQIAITTN